MLASKQSSGFTIVELLVVIVVIGILASVTIVSYAGISNRATAASLQSDLENASKQIKLYQVVNSNYPDTLAAANVTFNTGTPTYYVNNTNPQVFCVSAAKSGQNFYINQDSAPMVGSCETANLITNPGFESTTVFLDTSGASGDVTGLSNNDQDSTHVLSGTYAAMAQSNGITGHRFLHTPSAFIPTIGDKYTFSAYVYIPIDSTITDIMISIRDYNTWAYLTPWVAQSLTPGVWTRISCSYTATSANTQWRLTLADPSGVTSGNPQSYWFDNAMLTNGSNLVNYADGTSRDWSWTGVADSSTSTGPAY